MSESLIIDKENTALLIMDYQYDVVEIISEERREPLLQKAASVLDAARAVGLPVLYIVNFFRNGYPEISQNNKVFSGVKAKGIIQEGSHGAEIRNEILPRDGELVINKHRSSVFHDTDLGTILRVKGITRLVIMGISTGGCVLSSLRMAADLDYDIVVISDACADPDKEIQNVLMRKVFPRQAKVVTVQEFISAIK